MTSWIRFGEQPQEIREILRLLEAFTFRSYAIVGRRSDTGVTRLNSLAHRVHQNELDHAGLVTELISINHDYGNNQRLQNSLRSEDFYQNPRRDIKYLLSEYEICLIPFLCDAAVFTLGGLMDSRFAGMTNGISAVYDLWRCYSELVLEGNQKRN